MKNTSDFLINHANQVSYIKIQVTNSQIIENHIIYYMPTNYRLSKQRLTLGSIE